MNSKACIPLRRYSPNLSKKFQVPGNRDKLQGCDAMPVLFF